MFNNVAGRIRGTNGDDGGGSVIGFQYSNIRTAIHEHEYTVEYRIPEGDDWIVQKSNLYFASRKCQHPATEAIIKKYPRARIVSVRMNGTK